jgi:hypothetical protein
MGEGRGQFENWTAWLSRLGGNSYCTRRSGRVRRAFPHEGEQKARGTDLEMSQPVIATVPHRLGKAEARDSKRTRGGADRIADTSD